MSAEPLPPTSRNASPSPAGTNGHGAPQGGAATRKAHVVSGSRRLEVWLMSEA